MSLLTLIDNIPLYSTQQEALQWGAALGMFGFHTHVFNGQLGYMTGGSHEDIDIVRSESNINLIDEENSVDLTTTPPPPRQIQIETPIDVEEPVE